MTKDQELAFVTLKNRWYPIAKAKSIKEIQDIVDKFSCSFCKKYLEEHKRHFCPLNDLDWDRNCAYACCEGLWDKFCVTRSNKDFPKAIQIANAIISHVRVQTDFWDEVTAEEDLGDKDLGDKEMKLHIEDNKNNPAECSQLIAFHEAERIRAEAEKKPKYVPTEEEKNLLKADEYVTPKLHAEYMTTTKKASDNNLYSIRCQDCAATNRYPRIGECAIGCSQAQIIYALTHQDEVSRIKEKLTQG